MTNTQSIIVYRSPVEAMFWEGGFAIPLFAALLMFFVVVVGLSALAQRFVWSRKWRGRDALTWAIMVVAAVAGVLTFQYLFI